MAELPAREAMEFDVVIVGAGPATERCDPVKAASGPWLSRWWRALTMVDSAISEATKNP